MSRSPSTSFRALVAAAAVSSTGDGLLLVAAPLLASSMTDRPALVTGAAVATRLPWLLAPFTGALADRVSRGRLFRAVELARAVLVLVFAALLATGSAGLAHLYVLSFLLATAETIFAAAALGAVPALVDDAHLARANGNLYAVQVAGEQFVGPAVGGLAFAAGTAIPFVVDGVSFLASAGLLLLAFPAVRRQRPAAHETSASIAADVRAGLSYLLRTPALRALTVAIGAFGFCQALVLSSLVLFAPSALGLSPGGFGVFLAVGAVGNVIGGAVAGHVRGRPGTIVAGAGTFAAVAYVLAGLSSSAATAAAAFVIEALCVSVAMVTTVTLRQRLIPVALLGRVGNAIRCAVYGAMALGAVASGVLVESFGVRAPLLAAGALQLAVVALFVHPRRARFNDIVPVALSAADAAHLAA